MNISRVEQLGFRDGSAVTFEVDAIPETCQEWSDSLADLPLRELIGIKPANVVPDTESAYTMVRRADQSQIRDWWAPDHTWHVDGTRRYRQPIYTVIACKEAAPDSPATQMLDLATLYEQSVEDGFWQQHGIQPGALKDFGSLFVDSTYFKEALPHILSHADASDRDAVRARIEEDLAKSHSANLEEHAAKDEVKNPPKVFPLVQLTPVKAIESIFIDGGVRNAAIIGPEGEDYKDVLNAFRWEYLAGNAPHARGVVRTIGWAANRCIIFPQVGTLHRAMPGNNTDRALHLGFLVEDSGIQ